MGPPPSQDRDIASISGHFLLTASLREPRQVLAEFGLELPPHVKIVVHDSTADCRYMVLPARPHWSHGWSRDQLSNIVTRDCLIGVAVPVMPENMN